MKLSPNQRAVIELSKELGRSDVSKDKVLSNLGHPVASVRGVATMALGRLATKDASLVPELVQVYHHPQSQTYVWDRIKIAYLAIEGLIRAGTPEALSLAESLLANENEDRELIVAYLESQGLRLRR
jgi:hypothetical protein